MHNIAVGCCRVGDARENCLSQKITIVSHLDYKEHDVNKYIAITSISGSTIMQSSSSSNTYQFFMVSRAADILFSSGSCRFKSKIITDCCWYDSVTAEMFIPILDAKALKNNIVLI